MQTMPCRILLTLLFVPLLEESKDTTPDEELAAGDDGVDEDDLDELPTFEEETNSGLKKKLHDLVSKDVWKKGLEVMAKKNTLQTRQAREYRANRKTKAIDQLMISLDGVKQKQSFGKVGVDRKRYPKWRSRLDDIMTDN